MEWIIISSEQEVTLIEKPKKDWLNIMSIINVGLGALALALNLSDGVSLTNIALTLGEINSLIIIVHKIRFRAGYKEETKEQDGKTL